MSEKAASPMDAASVDAPQEARLDDGTFRDAVLSVLDAVIAEVWLRTEDEAQERLLNRMRHVIHEMTPKEPSDDV